MATERPLKPNNLEVMLGRGRQGPNRRLGPNDGPAIRFRSAKRERCGDTCQKAVTGQKGWGGFGMTPWGVVGWGFRAGQCHRGVQQTSRLFGHGWESGWEQEPAVTRLERS